MQSKLSYNKDSQQSIYAAPQPVLHNNAANYLAVAVFSLVGYAGVVHLARFLFG